MTSRIKVERLSPALKAEVERLWEVYKQDTGFMTFDEWIIATQTEPGRKAVSLAAERTFDAVATASAMDRSLAFSVER
jgi:hypothetical protein